MAVDIVAVMTEQWNNQTQELQSTGSALRNIGSLASRYELTLPTDP